MKKDIISKLSVELRRGITTEAQVVYLMTAVRKLLEQQEARSHYENLTFHCDWAVHSKLSGRMAQRILAQFDAANIHLKEGVKLRELPSDLRGEIDRISKMKNFKSELTAFLKANGLPTLEEARADGWVHFLHLYAKVVEDCPLVVAGNPRASGSIVNVTLNIKMADRPEEGEMFFKVTWTISDKNGQSGDIFVLNSFSLVP